jgi:hypothetical protein
MESAQYKIQFSTIGIGSGKDASETYKLNTSVGQTAAGTFTSAGYIVKAGFQYISSIIRFRFAVSNTLINFGNVVSQTPATATTNLTVSFGGAGEYQVTAIEETALRKLDNTTIPDTACDGGTPCTKSSANIWNSSSTYGFGYNMSGNDIPGDFSGATYYRPFANRANADSPVVVMSSSNVGRGRQSTMTFKLNVGPTQAGGAYQTVVNFVATPSY